MTLFRRAGTIASLFSLASLAACSPTAAQMKKAVEDHPEILTVAMEKHPEAFMRAFDLAASKARAAEDERSLAHERELREQEIKTPLRPVLDSARAYDGPDHAPVTIVEYSDFECPYCRRGAATIDQLLRRYPGKIRVLLKHTPNASIHPYAGLAARYYEAVAMQDAVKAHAFKRRLFRRQDDISTSGETVLIEEARASGVDIARLAHDVTSAAITRRIVADSVEGARFGLVGTPSYVVNGVSIRGAYPLDVFVTLVDRHLGAQ